MANSKMFKAEKYTAGNTMFPSDEISPLKKRQGDSSREFCMQFAKAFYWGWGNGNFAYTQFSDRDKMINLRNYARGKQSLDTYYDFWYGRNDQNQLIRKGFMNINWEVLAVVLKFKDAFISKLNEYEYDPMISSQDQYSRNERQEKMMEDYIRNKMKSIFPKGQDENNIAPESIAEFEILNQMGVYKNKAEYCWEKFINFTFNGFNKWDLKLKNKLLDDIFSLGRLCVRDYVDPDTQTVKIQYIDPVNTIIRLTTDGEVIDGGYIDLMTVQDLKKASGLDEDTLFSIAKNACGWYGNPGNWDGSGWQWGVSYQDWMATAAPRTSVGNCEWYSFRVPVLKCEYRSVDTEYYTEQELGDGTKKYSRAKHGKVFKQSPTRTTIQKNTINYYTCSWIVGTEHCYDYGLQYDMPRPERAEARCSFHYFQMDDPSISERLKPAIDLTLNAWYAFQNAISKSRPSGNLYDMGVLQNVDVGGKIKPADIIKGINQTGSGIFKSINKRADRPVVAPNMGPPVIPMKGGYEDAANDFSIAFNLLQGIMADLAGMTPSFTGGSDIPEGAKVNQGQMIASVALLKPKIDAYYFVRSSCALNILLRGQVIFRHNEKMTAEYRHILGDEVVEILKTASEKNYAQYGMTMNLRINGDLKMKIEQAATAALQAGRNGQPGITFMEYFKILNMLESGVEIKYIEGFLERLINKREQQMRMEALQNQDNQNKGLLAIEQQKIQGQMESAKFMTDLKIQENFMAEASKAYFASQAMGTQAGHDFAGNALQMIMETTMQQYLQTMGGQKPAA